MNDIDITVQVKSKASDLPNKTKLKNWAISALQNVSKAEITIRIVDEEESAFLNSTYRYKDGATNVLSFPYQHPHMPEILLGDIVICAPLVKTEAVELHKNEMAHWAHLTIHGILHLQGYDHIAEEDAIKMESLETSILEQLGFPDPYSI